MALVPGSSLNFELLCAFVLNSSWVRLEELHFSLTSFFKDVVNLVEAVVFTLVYVSGSQSLVCISITSLQVSLRQCYWTPDSRVDDLVVGGYGVEPENFTF